MILVFNLGQESQGKSIKSTRLRILVTDTDTLSQIYSSSNIVDKLDRMIKQYLGITIIQGSRRLPTHDGSLEKLIKPGLRVQAKRNDKLDDK